MLMATKQRPFWLTLVAGACFFTTRVHSFNTAGNTRYAHVVLRPLQHQEPKELRLTSYPKPHGTRRKGAQESDSSSWLSPSPLDRPVLALIDLAALLFFAGIGKASHNAADSSLDVVGVVGVAFPFLVSWFATSPITGVYSADERNGNVVQDAGFKAARGWIVAVPLGCVLRSGIKGYAVPIPFVVVTMIATFVLLVGARVVFALVEDFFVQMVK
jgi:hypothetical protein